MKEAIFIVLAASLIWLAACTPQTDLTYTQDIAPIIYQNCTPCHRSGGAAPFLLTEYQHVFRKKKTILAVTQSGLMPPWPADRMYSHFLGERYLSDSDKDKLKRWIEGGAPEGDVSLLPDLPSFNEFSLIGKPDTTLWFDSILIKGDSKDKFYIATLPIELPENKFVRAMEFLPNQNNLVHHMNGRLLNYDEGKKANIKSGERLLNLEADEDEYIQQFNALNLANDDGSRPPQINSATNYLPGVQAQLYPEGIGGFAMHKKSILLADDIHFGPISQDKWDHSRVNIFFSKTPPKRPINEVMMGTNGVSKIIPPLVIRANKVTTHTTFLKIPQDISVLTINPHMHLLGKSFKAYALTPNQDTIRLISIPKWDFRWQYFYTFPKMLKIPAQSVIYVEATYDNTTHNYNNPNNPPKEIRERLGNGGAGMRTTDEMLQFIITWLPYQVGDENLSLEAK
ncbi:MAG TPA: hypothetical protein DD396_07700 [Bacteroidetes bacterium]|jgi:hypothetical protein|nr:hypothetical protein [Bacteroidota bacterium]